MKIETAVRALGLKELTPCASTEFDGVYVGDFLSRAMSRVEEGNLWVTIMSNVNVVAVASLSDAAAVILAEGVAMAPDVIDAAREKGVAVFTSEMSAYDICVALGNMASDE
ncbi:MAG: hypothetical protein IKN38_07035 [Clostridia bacterium]|nr:hypothetical protein [Clostridia bacterium]